MTGGTIVWFRQDLRLRDNPALHAAAARKQPVIPVYIWSPEEEGNWAPGSASRWWLHHSLQSLDHGLRKLDLRLILATGPAAHALARVAACTGARAVHWNERYEPAALQCSSRVTHELRRSGLETNTFNSALLTEPRTFLNKSGRPYQVYTAFQRAVLRDLDPGKPLPAPGRMQRPARWPKSQSLPSLGLLPTIRWYETMATTWAPGEIGANSQFARFRRVAMGGYGQTREIPSLAGTSRLSPHLHFGEIGPRQIWHALGPRGRSSQFLRELLWREFAYHLLYHFPQTVEAPLRPQFARFPWRRNRKRLTAWQRGRTGIPLVDAGMRELWARGWMHNRVRMIVGSFLVKNLLVPWQEGARWFWDTLVDADLANNTLNWQWVAGCGADAAPYFRIFNPLTQAKRFDPHGLYVHKWVPELTDPTVTKYPAPIVSLSESREAALEAWHDMRSRRDSPEPRPR